MGLWDLFVGDVKDENDAMRAEMKEDREAHAARVERLEKANDQKFQDKVNREKMLQQQERDEKEYARLQQKEFEEAQKIQKTINDEQYMKIRMDNKDRIAKMDMMTEETLRSERARMDVDKNTITDRNLAELICIEGRQKEVETEHGKQVREAEKEKSVLQNAKIAEAHQNAEKLDQERSKHNEKLVALKKEQNAAEIVGAEQEKNFELRRNAQMATFSKGRQNLIAAHSADLNARQKTTLINNIWKENESLSENAIKIKAKVGVAIKRGKPTKVTTQMIFNIDALDEERKEAATEALKTLEEVTSITEGWNSYSEEGADPGETIQAISAGLEQFNNFVSLLTEQLRAIPAAVSDHPTFEKVIRSTCEAITRNVNIGNQQLGLTEGPSSSKYANNY